MKKMKIIFDEPFIKSEDQTFVCSLCNKAQPEWMAQHNGKHPICIRHERPRGDAMNKNFDSYYDSLQIDAARIVIKEIENVARK